MNKNKRRSLGTKKLEELVPKPLGKAPQDRENVRPSSVRISQATPISGQRGRNPLTKLPSGGAPGFSRLPMSRQSGRPSDFRGNGPRSSSIHARPSAMSGLKTPRSLSASGRTPKSGTRMPVYNPRPSLAGSGKKSEADRLSTIGTKSRVMQDKGYQREVEKEILDFCHQHNYPNLNLCQQSFPLSSTEFKSLFAYLMRFLVPEFPDLTTGFESEIPVILKDTLGYPAHVSKQTFQTLGTLHSWPAVLSCLYFVYNRTKLVAALSEVMPNDLEFINIDGDGFRKDESSKAGLEPAFDCFMDMYIDFNAGSVDYDDFLRELEMKLMENDGIVRSKIDQRLLAYEKISVEIHAAKKESQQYHVHSKQLKETLTAIKSDREKLADDYRKRKSMVENRNKHTETLCDASSTKAEKIDDLQTLVTELRSICINEKKIDPDNCSGVSRVITSLEDQVHTLRARLSESDNTKWQLELAKQEAVSVLEGICLTFNRQLMAMDESADPEPFRLETKTSSQVVRNFMHKLGMDLRHADCTVIEAITSLERELQHEVRDVNRLIKERDSIREGLEFKCGEFKRLKIEVEITTAKYAELLQELKSSLIDLQDEGHKDLEKLDRTLLEKKKELIAKKREFEITKVDLKEILEKTAEVLKIKHQKQIEYFQKLQDEYKRQSKEKVAQIEEETAQIKNLHKWIPKPNRRNNKT